MSPTENSQAIIVLPKAIVLNKKSESLLKRIIGFFTSMSKNDCIEKGESVNIEMEAERLMADSFAKIGNLEDLRKSYSIIGEEIPKEKLIQCGKVNFLRYKKNRDDRKGWLAFRAFEEAGDSTKLAELCEFTFTKSINLRISAKIFEIFDDKTKLIKCAERMLSRIGRYSKEDAREIFRIVASMDE